MSSERYNNNNEESTGYNNNYMKDFDSSRVTIVTKT